MHDEVVSEVAVSVGVDEVLRLALQTYVDGKIAANWMESKVSALGNRRPIEFLGDPRGRYQVWVVLQRAAHGIF